MDRPSLLHFAASSLLAGLALGATGCAEVYTPRGPNLAVALDPGSGPKVFRQGRSIDSLEEAVKGNARAEEQARIASSQGTAASVLGVIGVVGTASGAAMFGIDAGQSIKNGQSFPSGLGIAGIAVTAASLGFSVASGALRASSQTHYFNAVNISNDESARTFAPYPALYGAPVPAPGFRPLPSFQGPAPGYTPPASPPPGVPPGLPASPPPGAPAPPGGALGPVPALPPGALPPPGSQPVPLSH